MPRPEDELPEVVYVSHFLDAAKSAAAEHADIRDLPEFTTDAADKDEAREDDTVGIKILKRLEELGAQDARIIRERLDQLDESDERRAHLQGVEAFFTEETANSNSPEQNSRLRALSRAVGALASAQIVANSNPPGSRAISYSMDLANAAVQIGAEFAGETAARALNIILNEVEAQHRPPNHGHGIGEI